MKLEDVLARIQEPEVLEALLPHWEESEASFPGETPSFLLPAEALRHRDYCGFGPEIDPLLLETARRIAADPALSHLAWHCYRLLYEHLDYTDTPRWPTLQHVLGEAGGVLYLLVVMGMVPRVRAIHQAMGVPDEVTRETCNQVCSVAGVYRRMSGRLGVTLNTVYWMRHYIAGRLFRLGRFEYMLRPFGGAVEVYRHRQTGAVVALAPDGWRFNGEGQVDGTGGVTDDERGWTASLTRTDDAVAGYPVSPQGMAVRHEVRLPKSEWECVLKQGDTVMEMHIPAGGNMTPERCGDSNHRAAQFFRRFFPDQPARAIVSISWIFNTQLEEITLSSDNLVLYQRELYLFPVPSSGRDGLWFIFLRDDLDPAALPRDTSLRRGVADFLAAGNVWRCGGMFFLADDLDHFGTQHYRSHWPPEGLAIA